MCSRQRISCYLLLATTVLTIQPDFFNVRGKLISVRLAHSICSQNDQFKQTQVIQPMVKVLPSQAEKSPCGWFSLSPQNKFLTCDQAKKIKQRGKKGRTANGKIKIKGKSAAHQFHDKIDWSDDLELNAKNLKLYKSLNKIVTERKSFEGGGSGRQRNGNKPSKPLPLAVAPQHYDLFFRPVLQSNSEWPWPYLTCPATVKILLDVKEATKRISLHKGSNITINSVTLTQTSNNETIQIVDQPFDEADQIQHFDLEKSLDSVEDGAYQLFIDFTAKVFNDSNLGLYEGKYQDDDNKTKNFGITQFQFDGTRLAFPSFDEPQFKSTFSISIARTAEYNSKSNSPQTETIDDPNHTGWYIDIYEKTKVKMACYVVVILVSDYTCEAGPDIFDKPVQMCAPPHIVSGGGTTFSANASSYLLKFLQLEYQFPYEMPKVDEFVVNKDYFTSIGMENWGLVAYGDSTIISKDGEPSEDFKERCLRLLAHELSHMWFGNIVTCKNWQNFWLNEGLTTFASRVYAHTNPEFDFPGPSDLRIIQISDFGDEVPVAGPESTVSQISYFKGSSIIHMFESVLGKDVLHDALVEYLHRHAYGNVVQDDLSEVLQEFAQKNNRLPQGKTMKDILDSWTYTRGLPLVRVQVEPESTGDEKTISLTQELYARKTESTTKNESSKDPVWEIPIYIISHKNPEIGDRTPDLWLSDSNTSVTTTGAVDPGSWHIFNGNGIGYYRVFYDNQLFDLLVTQLETDHTVINKLARAKLVDDYSKFLESGNIDIVTCLKLTKYLLSETDRFVWFTVFYGLLRFLEPRLISRDEYKEYWSARIDNLLKFVNMDKKGEGGSEAIFKGEALEKAAIMNIPSFISKSSALVEEWKTSGDSKSPIPPDYREGIYCGAVADIDNSQFDFIFNIYQENPKKYASLVDPLFCSQNPKDIRRALEATLNPSLFDLFNLYSLYTVDVLARSSNRDPLLEFLDEKFQDIVKTYELSLIEQSVTELNKGGFDLNERDKTVKFLEKHRADFGEETDEMIKNTKDKYDKNIKWMDQVGRPALEWMAQNT